MQINAGTHLYTVGFSAKSRRKRSEQDPPVTIARTTTRLARRHLLQTDVFLTALREEGNKQGKIVTHLGHVPKSIIKGLSKLAGAPITEEAVLKGFDELSKHHVGVNYYGPRGNPFALYIDGIAKPLRVNMMGGGAHTTIIGIPNKVQNWVLKVFNWQWTDGARNYLKENDISTFLHGGAHDSLKAGLFFNANQVNNVPLVPCGSPYHGWILMRAITPDSKMLSRASQGPSLETLMQQLGENMPETRPGDIILGPNSKSYRVDLEDF